MMSRKLRLTKESINERIADRGITMIGDYLGTVRKTSFGCQNGHTWMATPDSVCHGSGCPHCSRNAKITEVEFLRRLAELDNGIQMIGRFTGFFSKTTFRCPENHEWDTMPAMITNRKSGCPHCYGNVPYTKDKINLELSKSGRKIVMIGDYDGYSSPTLFKCELCDNEWMSSLSSIMHSAKCPGCAEWGYNPTKPGYIYVIDFTTFIKYGISNSPDRRFKEHNRKLSGNVVECRRFEDGRLPLLWEKEIKSEFGGRYVGKEVLKNGWTETLPPELKDKVISWWV